MGLPSTIIFGHGKGRLHGCWENHRKTIEETGLAHKNAGTAMVFIPLRSYTTTNYVGSKRF
ncbi:hypothetical protein PAXINDRAFT_19969 [Paxillus involutus ATCC 200175]|uniref:Unplaced genomic scaffold PAXINscaffold_816, whole genome shotgun sequence n=1 Tax=Paxillus involutus ATCC 200175 TaxID=664439 RepID=A0A0C9THL8_PAXIN|nr:hypothetical protein PAXINDRAFT_19969 [Paxillus involutus ATCC 200175]